jgi:hypothetical protein
MATSNPFEGQPSSFAKAVFLQGFNGILRTGREVPATGRSQGGNIFLIPSDQ